MISILRTNLLISPFLLLVLTFILRIKAFVSPASYELNGTEGPLFLPIYNLININPIVEILISGFLVFVQGFLINRIAMNHNLIRPPNFVIGFCFIVLASLSVHFLGFSSFLLANFFMLLAFNELFLTYKVYRSSIHIFNAGCFLSIAALIHFPFIILYFACSISLLLIRSYKVRERLQLLTGFLLPFYLIGIWFYLSGQLESFISEYVRIELTMIPVSFKLSASNIVFGVYLFFTLISILFYRRSVVKKGLEVEKKIDSLYWLMFFIFITAFFSGPLGISYLLSLAMPLSVFMAMFLISLRRQFISEFIALALIITTLITHFYL